MRRMLWIDRKNKTEMSRFYLGRNQNHDQRGEQRTGKNE